MTDIRAALTRKFGPLPAWAWLTIVGVAAYVWRSRGGGGASGGGTAATDITPTEAPEPQDPITLGPGESVYNPGTGQLVSTAPEQQPAEAPEQFAPIVAAPGESIYDPRTGAFYPGQPEAADDVDTPISDGAKPAAAAAAPKPNAIARAKAAVTTGKVGKINRQRLRKEGYSDAQIDYHAKRKTPLQKPAGKRVQKQKTQHKPATPVKHPTPSKSRSRSTGTHKTPTTRTKNKATAQHKTPKSRARPTAPPKTTARARATAPARPVTRQRPAPAHTTPRTPPRTPAKNARSKGKKK